MTKHAKQYDTTKTITFRQRLALTLGAKQNQRPAKHWA